MTAPKPNLRRLGCLFSLVLAAAAQAAPPNATYLFPAGARRGGTVEVTAGGTFERWPVGVHVVGAGVTAKAAKDKGKLAVTVDAAAVPGLYWLRLHDEEGASAPRPFVVGTLPEVEEREPNNELAKPQVLPASATVNGRLDKMDDVDAFAVKLAKGQTLVASLDANRRLGSPMDAILEVVSSEGFVLAENHDTRGLDPQVVFTAPAAGTYLVRLFCFPSQPNSTIRFAGGEDYLYRLTVTTDGFVDHPMPTAVSRAKLAPVEMVGWNVPDAARRLPVVPEKDSDEVRLWHPLLANTAEVRVEPHATLVEQEPNPPERAQAIVLPVTVSGRIEGAGDVDAFRFTARKGERWAFQVETEDFDSPLDPVLRLLDAAGKVVAEFTGQARRRQKPEFSATIPADGDYRLAVGDLFDAGGPRYVYRLRAVTLVPDFELTVADDRLTAGSGQPLEVTVTVERRNGFKEPIELRVEGLPNGVKAAPVVVAEKDRTAKLTLTAPPGPLAGPVRIVGKAKETSRSATAALAAVSTTTPDLWLTVLKPGMKAPAPAKPMRKRGTTAE